MTSRPTMTSIEVPRRNNSVYDRSSGNDKGADGIIEKSMAELEAAL